MFAFPVFPRRLFGHSIHYVSTCPRPGALYYSAFGVQASEWTKRASELYAALDQLYISTNNSSTNNLVSCIFKWNCYNKLAVAWLLVASYERKRSIRKSRATVFFLPAALPWFVMQIRWRRLPFSLYSHIHDSGQFNEYALTWWKIKFNCKSFPNIRWKLQIELS